MEYTSEQILEMDDAYLEHGDSYILTGGEIDWWNFIAGKYSISDMLDKYTEPHETIEDSFVLTWTYDAEWDISQALKDDGIPYKAVMLSDDSALQKILFYNNVNE